MNPDKINILIKMDNLFSLSVTIKKLKKQCFSIFIIYIYHAIHNYTFFHSLNDNSLL